MVRPAPCESQEEVVGFVFCLFSSCLINWCTFPPLISEEMYIFGVNCLFNREPMQNYHLISGLFQVWEPRISPDVSPKVNIRRARRRGCLIRRQQNSPNGGGGRGKVSVKNPVVYSPALRFGDFSFLFKQMLVCFGDMFRSSDVTSDSNRFSF